MFVLVGVPSWYAVTALISRFRLRNILGPFLASLSYLWHGRTRKLEHIYRSSKRNTVVAYGSVRMSFSPMIPT